MENSTKSIQKSVSFYTHGCRLNFSETGSIAQGFVDRGYKVVEFGAPADVTFINTCTVTDGADSSCRNTIRKAHKTSPEGRIVVAGCYAQMNPQEIADMQGVDLILGSSEKYKVFDYLEEVSDQAIKVDKTNEFWGAATTLADSHTRAFLKIQDGCNYVCSFCIIPQARGRSRTITVQQAVDEASQLVTKGYKEIVLTGVNIGEYASTSGESLEDLVKRILDIDGLERLRLGSVEPNTITESLLQTLKDSPKAMDHFHVPMQSGSNEILTSMRRKYLKEDYIDIISRIIDYFPNAGIGADVIVGYPGETRAQFEETKQLLTKLPITHFHVFPFSKRQKTLASRMESRVHHEEKKSRVKELLALGELKLRDLAQTQLELTNSVLFERPDEDGFFHGYTSNFIKVKVKTDQDLKNQICSVRLNSQSGETLVGELLQ
jgi:threonylcarbamoyladenosine tRNA methylthiotransferase MtaB